MRGKQQGGFTLLEVMIAIGILGIALAWLGEATTRAVAAENHAKLLTTATLLAREQMVQLEDDLQEKGMQDDSFASEQTGDFKDDGFQRFKWHRLVDKITLPDQSAVQTALGQAGNTDPFGGFSDSDSQKGASPLSMLGMLGGGAGNQTSGAANSIGMISGQFGIVKEVLEQGIRRVTVTVTWTERGIPQQVEVVEYITDPRRVDQAISIPQQVGAQSQAQQASSSSSSSGSSVKK